MTNSILYDLFTFGSHLEIYNNARFAKVTNTGFYKLLRTEPNILKTYG